mmetsp:Transcript_15807/g.36597  ORF Transcript_15807/g.36597 Transcript_15807/m.36597 type:complete len:333 (+) Transcript_15807:180-1178(+)
MQRSTVSDEDAMMALLSSAEQSSLEREREGRNSGYSQQKRENGRDRTRSYRGRSSRWGEEGNHSKKNTNEVSYYGPGGKHDDNHKKEDEISYDRKRKRISDREGGRVRDERLSSRGDGKNHRADNGPRLVENDGDESESKRKIRDGNDGEEAEKSPPEFKPNFGLSGALAKDTKTGNVYKGVLLKFKEPPEARAPKTQWRLYVFKPRKDSGDSKRPDDSELVETLHISKQSAYLLGRNSDIADIPVLHPSLSSQHAVLQYRAMPVSSDKVGATTRLSCQPYIMDLESTNGTFLNGVRIDAARYYQLKRGDVLTFGASTREYVVLTENTTSLS